MTDTELTIKDKNPYDLSKFKTDKILQNNSTRKSACILGHFTDDNNSTENRALIILEKNAFTPQTIGINDNNDNDENSTNQNLSFFSVLSKLKTDFINDIYGNFQCFPNPDINSNYCHVIEIYCFYFPFVVFFLFFFRTQVLKRQSFVQQQTNIYKSINHKLYILSKKHTNYIKN